MSHLSYRDLIDQTYDFPQLGFDVSKEGNLMWNGVDLMEQVQRNSPVKMTYLPKIREKGPIC